MNKDYWLRWLRAAGVRAVKTFAQVCVALIPAGVTIEAVDWHVVVSTAILSAVLSMLTSLAGIPEVTDLREDK